MLTFSEHGMEKIVVEEESVQISQGECSKAATHALVSNKIRSTITCEPYRQPRRKIKR